VSAILVAFGLSRDWLWVGNPSSRTSLGTEARACSETLAEVSVASQRARLCVGGGGRECNGAGLMAVVQWCSGAVVQSLWTAGDKCFRCAWSKARRQRWHSRTKAGRLDQEAMCMPAGRDWAVASRSLEPPPNRQSSWWWPAQAQLGRGRPCRQRIVGAGTALLAVSCSRHAFPWRRQRPVASEG
jgi:hypothetical protein